MTTPFRSPLGWSELIDDIRGEMNDLASSTDSAIDNEQYQHIAKMKALAERLLAACEGWKEIADCEAEAERLVAMSHRERKTERRQYQADWMGE